MGLSDVRQRLFRNDHHADRPNPKSAFLQVPEIGSDVVNPWQRELGAEPAQMELAQEHQIRYWSDWFRCTPIELLAVVGLVGRSIPLVEAEIARRAALKKRPLIR